MKRAHGNRIWRGMVLTAAIGAVAVLAMAGLATARSGHEGEHHRHGSDTGTIASFDTGTGVLAIQLSGGGDTVSGLVTRHTKIRCEDERSPDVSSRTFRRESGSNSGPGSGSDDNGGRGEEEPGDDRDGHGNEPGDDRGGRGPSGHDDNGAGANCTVSDLIAGTVVHEAELELRNGKAIWDEVELSD
jgi:hypothetical protein